MKTTEVKTSFGSDDDSIRLIFKARQFSTSNGPKEGSYVKISTSEFGVIKNGQIVPIKNSEVPAPFLDAYNKFENLDVPPKYPYLVELVNGAANEQSEKANKIPSA